MVAAAAIPSLPSNRADYPAGQAGVDQTIAKVISYIHDARGNPLAKQFAEGIVRGAGYSPNDRLTNTQVFQAFLDYVRKNVRYRPDPHMTEYVQHPKITLCVPGAAMCIPVEDCDGGACVLGWLGTAYGIPVRLLIQHFNSDTDHVLLEFQADSGAWLAADFSNFNSDNNPIGWKPKAASEYRIDPFDRDNLSVAGARDVEFVTVGRVPRMMTDGPVVTLGRLPPREVGVYRRRVLGALGAAFQQAETDLANQVTAVIAAGDTYMSATPPEYDAAIAAYKAAGNAGATSVGPQIDLAGASWITQPLTHQAWVSNGDLQKLSGADAATAQKAKTFISNMQALWQQAINDGSSALAAGKTAPQPTSTSKAALWVVGIGILGGIVFGSQLTSKRKRR